MCNEETIKIPLKEPVFSLVLLTMAPPYESKTAVAEASQIYSADKSGERVRHVIKSSSTVVREMEEAESERFLECLDFCNLSEAETVFCRRAQSIFNITSTRNSSAFFDPFWACQAVAHDLNQALDSTVIDLHQGSIVTTDSGSRPQEAFGIPLTEAYLTVKAYPAAGLPNTYNIYTEGMSRFGLPELKLPDLASNLLNDGAYMIRTIAQFLWSRLEHIHPEQPYLEINAELEIPTEFCEYGNVDFHTVKGDSLPVSLEVILGENETILVVKHPEKYDDFYDWFLSVNEAIRELRLSIQNLQLSDDRVVISTEIAA
jgi:hypothetical protein